MKTRFLSLAQATEDLYQAQNVMEYIHKDPEAASLRAQCPELSKLVVDPDFSARKRQTSGMSFCSGVHHTRVKTTFFAEKIALFFQN